jgi:hypothetical protein
VKEAALRVYAAAAALFPGEHARYGVSSRETVAVVTRDDALYPRDAQHRYRLYARTGTELRVLACAPDAGGVGQAIICLDEDALRAGGSGLGDSGAIGVFDTRPDEPTGRWIISPWHRPEPR